ncbi:hypothetical protein [Symbioplanes lichenis]|uniref:hypothetical protein n=1 Tax=Symbioplanes lichenis TaxID=1629072 RepID=UPI0027383B32|nr:hypothetical protein [Actinoplanes lichenis]
MPAGTPEAGVAELPAGAAEAGAAALDAGCEPVVGWAPVLVAGRAAAPVVGWAPVPVAGRAAAPVVGWAPAPVVGWVGAPEVGRPGAPEVGWGARPLVPLTLGPEGVPGPRNRLAGGVGWLSGSGAGLTWPEGEAPPCDQGRPVPSGAGGTLCPGTPAPETPLLP